MIDNTIHQQTLQMQKRDGGHIYYSFSQLEKYMNNAIAFIRAGLELGDYILFLENERIWGLLKPKLHQLFSSEEIEKIIYANNFDIYCLNQDFHTHSIIEYAQKWHEPYIQDKISYRSWAHVEWSDQENMAEKLLDYELEADRVVKEMNLIAVCAYDSTRVTDEMEIFLKKSHSYLMTDDNIFPSELYRKLINES